MSSSLATDKSSDLPSILAACFGIGAFGLALGLTYPLLTVLLMERGIAPHVIGLNAATMGVGIAISTVFMSRLTARHGAGSLITAGLLGAAGVILAFGFTDSIAVWFGLRVALGFAVNAVFVLTEAWVNAAAADGIRGRAVGGFTLSLSAGFALGPPGDSPAGGRIGASLRGVRGPGVDDCDRHRAHVAPRQGRGADRSRGIAQAIRSGRTAAGDHGHGLRVLRLDHDLDDAGLFPRQGDERRRVVGNGVRRPFRDDPDWRAHRRFQTMK
jgi:hypothetical protein